MTVVDIFKVVVFFAAIAGLFLLTASYAVVTSLHAIVNATTGIPTYTPSTLVSGGISAALFLPTAAIIMMIVLIIFSWMLSAFIKASPLGAVISVGWLIIYTIAAFFVSHYLILTARIPIYSSLGASGNFVFLWFANMPLILVFATAVDIGIAVLSWRNG